MKFFLLLLGWLYIAGIGFKNVRGNAETIGAGIGMIVLLIFILVTSL